MRLRTVGAARGRAAELDCITWPASLKALVNIGGCGKHATSNRNSYEPFRPQKNGRLGAEPDTAIYLEPLGDYPPALFLFIESSQGCAEPNAIVALVRAKQPIGLSP